MAMHHEPIHTRPEFDQLGPLNTEQRVLLRVIGPVLQAGFLVTMPPKTYRSHRIPRGYAARHASEDEWAALPVGARSHIEDAERALHSLGFGPPRHEMESRTATATVYSSHLFNPTTHDLATVFAAVAPRRFTHFGVAFRTWWDDGAQTVTSNSAEAELFASLQRPRMRDSLALPGLDDVTRLYAIHRARGSEVTGRRPIGNGWDDPVDNPLVLLRRWNEEWEQRVLETGIFRPDGDQAMRPGWKGAILLAWARLEPFQSYLAWRGRRRTAKALARAT